MLALNVSLFTHNSIALANSPLISISLSEIFWITPHRLNSLCLTVVILQYPILSFSFHVPDQESLFLGTGYFNLLR